MKIEYEFISMPKEDQKKYFQAYIEGVLRIYLLGQLYLEEPNFLLAEFAYALKKWLKEIQVGQISNFVYETMDSDEVPILCFKNTESGIVIKSVWEKFECDAIFDREIIIKKLNKFVNDVNDVLESKLGVSLSE